MNGHMSYRVEVMSSMVGGLGSAELDGLYIVQKAEQLRVAGQAAFGNKTPVEEYRIAQIARYEARDASRALARQSISPDVDIWQKQRRSVHGWRLFDIPIQRGVSRQEETLALTDRGVLVAGEVGAAYPPMLRPGEPIFFVDAERVIGLSPGQKGNPHLARFALALTIRRHGLQVQDIPVK